MGQAGAYVNHFGVRCFSPAPLPPQPALDMTPALQNLLSQADRALARLDGASSTVPNPDLFVYAFLRQEAALSSQIEGTQASLDDLFESEADARSVERVSDVDDIVNYLAAVSWGLDALHELPLSLRFVRELHKRLLASGRGANRTPGEFRKGQNHIGPPGCSIEEATFVPPAVPLLKPALGAWEEYLHDRDQPPLIRAALAHAQFETIHPFWDGNGRVGRMLITLILINEEILERPLLYLSLFFKENRSEYYDNLQSIRDTGDWESWVAFFLRGVRATSRSALDTARRINLLRDAVLAEAGRIGNSANYARLAEALFRNPYVTANSAAKVLDATYQTGSNIINRFVRAGILRPASSRRRGRVFVFTRYVAILNEASTDADGGTTPALRRTAEETQGSG